jgi:hypothetical protein
VGAIQNLRKGRKYCMPRGKSVKIFMMDGEPSGRWVCNLAGRTTKAYIIPRKYYKKCSDIDDLKKPSVYLLVGEDDATGQKVIYIGETEDAFDRLGDHVDKKDYWKTAIAFVSQDEHFNKAHVKYLESRLYDIAVEVERYKVMNTAKPKAPSLATDEQVEMEDFIDNVKILTYVLGYRAFEPLVQIPSKIVKSDDTNDFFYIKGRNFNAKMYRSSEGYVLCKGSVINELKKSIPAWAAKKRKEMENDGSLVKNKVMKDIVFTSPSGASDFVSSYSTSGKQKWKNISGKTLGEVLEEEDDGKK